MHRRSCITALTSFGVRGAICGSRLFEIKTMAFAGRIHISPAQRLHEASAQGRCSTEGATPSHPTPGIVQHAKQSASRKPSFWPSAAGVRDSTVRRAEPNPSLEARPNGRPPGPVWRYAYIFASPGLASCRWSRLSSNVRHQNRVRAVLQQSQRLRRELNSHKAAKPQEGSCPQWCASQRASAGCRGA